MLSLMPKKNDGTLVLNEQDRELLLTLVNKFGAVVTNDMANTTDDEKNTQLTKLINEELTRMGADFHIITVEEDVAKELLRRSILGEHDWDETMMEAMRATVMGSFAHSMNQMSPLLAFLKMGNAFVHECSRSLLKATDEERKNSEEGRVKNMHRVHQLVLRAPIGTMVDHVLNNNHSEKCPVKRMNLDREELLKDLIAITQDKFDGVQDTIIEEMTTLVSLVNGTATKH